MFLKLLLFNVSKVLQTANNNPWYLHGLIYDIINNGNILIFGRQLNNTFLLRNCQSDWCSILFIHCHLFPVYTLTHIMVYIYWNEIEMNTIYLFTPNRWYHLIWIPLTTPLENKGKYQFISLVLKYIHVYPHKIVLPVVIVFILNY